MDTTTLTYMGLAALGGLGYWFYFWLGSKEPFMLRKAAKTWIATAVVCVGGFLAAPISGPLTVLSAWGALSLGVAAARGMDWAKDTLAGK